LPTGGAGRPVASEAATELELFFDRLLDTFAHARGRGGNAVEHSLRIGGHTVTVAFANSSLAGRLVPAISHLCVGTGEPSRYRLLAWDTASTRARIPSPPWNGGDYFGNGEIRGCLTGRFRAAFDTTAGTLSMLDCERRIGLLWIRDAARLPGYVVAAPFRVVLSWWGSMHGLQLLHAGAVGTPSGGVLVAGEGGAGKSSICLSCLLDGLCYLGDDYVLTGLARSLMAYSLYNSGKLAPENLRLRFPDLLPFLRHGPRVNHEKDVLFAHQHWPTLTVGELPIRAILLPRIGSAGSASLVPISPAAVLRDLLPHSLFPLPGARHAAFAGLARVVRSVPCYALEIGSDLRRVAGLVRELCRDGVNRG
jgi:hypothetical protein